MKKPTGEYLRPYLRLYLGASDRKFKVRLEPIIDELCNAFYAGAGASLMHFAELDSLEQVDEVIHALKTECDAYAAKRGHP